MIIKRLRWSRHQRFSRYSAATLLAAGLCACTVGQQPTQRDDEPPTSRSQSAVGESMAVPAEPRAAGELISRYPTAHPPLQRWEGPTLAPPPIDSCPLAKRARLDWTQLEAAKAARVIEAEAAAKPDEPPPPAPDEYQKRQKDFLEAAQSMQAQFDAMSATEREVAHAELKQKMLGNN